MAEPSNDPLPGVTSGGLRPRIRPSPPSPAAAGGSTRPDPVRQRFPGLAPGLIAPTPAPRVSRIGCQYASLLTTSPPLRLPRLCQIFTLMEFLMY